MAPNIIIPIQILLAYAASKVVAAVGDTVIGATTKTVRAAGAAVEKKVSSMEEKAAEQRVRAADARVEAMHAEERADDLCAKHEEASVKETNKSVPWDSVVASA